MIQDSGTRREFESGAVRDMAEGKGRCDLMPLYEVGVLLSEGDYNEIFKCFKSLYSCLDEKRIHARDTHMHWTLFVNSRL